MAGGTYNAEVMTDPMCFIARRFETIAIVGVGLIGGSIALAAKERDIADTMIGVGRNPERLADALANGVIDAAFADLGVAAAQADLIIFCTPVDRIVAGVRQAAPACRAGTIITDAGSVKGTICRELTAGLPAGVDFVGGHPLAGSERQGFEHAKAQLFEKRVCVLTPTANTPRLAVERVSEFWQALGARTIEMTPEAHDQALACTSHLPHVVAAALAGTLTKDEFPFTASGFRDTTRIAAGDPDLWTAILLANRDGILAGLERYGETLNQFRRALEQNDPASLKDLLATAKLARKQCDTK
jgi:prephenate dehydrogenase